MASAVMSGERMPLPPVHTAVLLHRRGPLCGPRVEDILFVYPGIIQGEELHLKVDALLEEHAVAACGEDEEGDIETEIILYWMYEDGTWSYDTYLSRIVSGAIAAEGGGNLS